VHPDARTKFQLGPAQHIKLDEALDAKRAPFGGRIIFGEIPEPACNRQNPKNRSIH
jgi:hypothetical protein